MSRWVSSCLIVIEEERYVFCIDNLIIQQRDLGSWDLSSGNNLFYLWIMSAFQCCNIRLNRKDH